jgi:hypothetical protein
MVDQISSGSSSSLHRLGNELNGATGAREANAVLSADVAETNAKAAGGTNYSDSASISDEALRRLDRDREVLKFGRQAVRQSQSHNAEKVAYFKDMLDSGRINDYLRSVDTDHLVNELLSGPAGGYLRQALKG